MKVLNHCKKCKWYY